MKRVAVIISPIYVGKKHLWQSINCLSDWIIIWILFLTENKAL